MDNRKKKGMAGETAAAAFLEKRGIHILIRNYRCPFGEIDLIGKGQGYLIVTEVKTRKNHRQGRPCEAVNRRKQYKICRVFDYFRMRYHLDEYVPVRFDVIEVDQKLECRWIKNAFEYQD